MTDLPRNTVLVGQAEQRLRSLPAASIDCVLTSPPYFGLRNYQMPGQIGLEPNVDAWVASLCTVMTEVARVLKPSGVVWLNLGDSYARTSAHGALPKSLVLAPEKLLLALSRDGWIVRNKVVWTKPNPMPTSVADRLTCAWEPIYLLTRSARYFFDLDAVRVPHRSRRTPSKQESRPDAKPAWAGPLAGDHSGLDRLRALGVPGHPLGKNPGDVWTQPTSTFRGGHHATFPESLLEAPLLAGCPEKTCARCGLPWRRRPVDRQLGHLAVLGQIQPSCGCADRAVPGIVLDPFIGSGTTGVVAQRLGRDWLGIELNPDFADIATARVAATRRPPSSRAA